MVQVDLDVRGILNLYESQSIDKKKCREFLEKFSKNDLIEHLLYTEEMQESEEALPL